MNIRLYKDSDYEMIVSWHLKAGMGFIPKDFISETSYIAENKGIPIYFSSLFLTNAKAVCWMENVIANPDTNKELREDGLQKLTNHLESEAKNNGSKRLVIFSYNDKVKNVYKGLGFTKTLDNVTTFAKEIK